MNDENQSSSQEIVNSEQPTTEIDSTQKQHSTALRVFVTVSAVLLVVAGIAVGLFIGLIINFCIKDCAPVSTLQGSAPIWMPLLSLVFTLPLARLIIKSVNRNKSSYRDQSISKEDKEIPS